MVWRKGLSASAIPTLPRVFGYETGDNRLSRYFLWGGVAAVVSVWAWLFFSKFKYLFGPSASAWDWAMFGMFSLLIASLLLLYVPIAMASYKEYNKRRDQRITVDQSGITYEAAGSQIQAPWDKVADYYKAPYRMGMLQVRHYVLETSAGVFDFSHRIEKPALLRAIIQRYATNVKEPGWRLRA